MRVFVTGGTGFIGREVVGRLCERGDDVTVLSRSGAAAAPTLPDSVRLIAGDPQYEGEWMDAVGDADAVIHLAGESVAAKRWTARVKQTIEDSRVDGTTNVVRAMAQAQRAPSVLVSASGIDYYPWAEELYAHTERFEDDPVAEDAPPGSSFLARVCRRWEESAFAATDRGTRVVVMRTGLVLGRGGALGPLSAPFRFFVGGRIGSGKQWTSWIDIDDLARAYLFAVDEPTVRGPVNAVSPANVRNQELCRALANVLGRPSWLPAPSPMLRVFVGEFADYIVHGRRAVPAALQAAGFEFHTPEVEVSLARHLAPGA